MAEYGFFNSVPGDIREYVSSYFTDAFRASCPDMVFDGNNALLVQKHNLAPMITRILPGKAMVHGYVFRSDTELSSDHSGAAAFRVDLVVLRLNIPAKVIGISTIRGGADGKAPSPVNGNGIHDLPLARVTIRNSRVDSIEDMRPKAQNDAQLLAEFRRISDEMETLKNENANLRRECESLSDYGPRTSLPSMMTYGTVDESTPIIEIFGDGADTTGLNSNMTIVSVSGNQFDYMGTGWSFAAPGGQFAMSKSDGGWIGVEKTGNSTFTMTSDVFDYYAAPYPGGLLRTYVNMLLDPASNGIVSPALYIQDESGNTLAGGSFPSEGTIGWNFGFPDPGLRRIKIVITFQSVSGGNLSARFRLSVGATEYTGYKKSEYSPGLIPLNTSKTISAPEGFKVYGSGGIVYLKDNGAPLPESVFLRTKERWKLAFFDTVHTPGTSIQVGQDRYRAYKVSFGTGGTAESKMYLGETLHITSRASDFGLSQFPADAVFHIEAK